MIVLDLKVVSDGNTIIIFDDITTETILEIRNTDFILDSHIQHHLARFLIERFLKLATDSLKEDKPI